MRHAAHKHAGSQPAVARIALYPSPPKKNGIETAGTRELCHQITQASHTVNLPVVLM
jgi:hypothetical protein